MSHDAADQGCRSRFKKTRLKTRFRLPKVHILGFLGSFLNHILKVQKLELNNLNHIELNHTLMTYPSIDLSLKYGV